MKNYNRFDIGLSQYAGFLLIISLVASSYIAIPHIRLIALGLLCSIFLIRFFFGYSMKKMPLVILLYMIFGFLLLMGYGYTRAPNYAFDKILIAFSYYVVLPFVLYNILTNAHLVKKFVSAASLAGMITVLIVIYAAGNPIDLLQNMERFHRYSLEGANPIQLSRYLGMSILLLIWYLHVKGRVTYLIAIIPVIIAALLYMIATGSKGPLLSLFFSVAIIIIYIGNLKSMLGIVLFSSLIVGYVIFSGVLPADFVQQRFIAKDIDEYSRYDAYTTALSSYADSSWLARLFGNGTGDFAYLWNKTDVRDYPHNIFVEVLYENGLLGLSVFFLLVILPVLYGHRFTKAKKIKKQDSSSMLIVLSLYIFSVLNAQVTGDIGSNFFIAVWGTLIVCLYFEKETTSKNTNNV